jgi:hypothetical protein
MPSLDKLALCITVMHLNPYIFEALIHDAESAFRRLVVAFSRLVVDWINVSVGWGGHYLDCFQNSAPVAFSADTANGQFVTGTIQSTGILAAGRNSIPEVTTKRPIYLTPR